MKATIVFVHGIGGYRHPTQTVTDWSGAVARGLRLAGHAQLADDLTHNPLTSCVLAQYSDLFLPSGAQGEQELPWDDERDAAELSTFLGAVATIMVEQAQTDRDRRTAEQALAQLTVVEGAQGLMETTRRVVSVATTLLDIPIIRGGVGLLSAPLMVSYLRQVTRYLSRRERDESGVSLDGRIRARIAAAVGGGPAIVLAHSLGSVVAYEALHEYPSDVLLFATFGSPLGLGTFVAPRVRPRPITVPACVAQWVNFWDRDDPVVGRPLSGRRVRANLDEVPLECRRVDADGFWVHPADRYFAHADVGGAIATALHGV
jgi:hypothetical protein